MTDAPSLAPSPAASPTRWWPYLAAIGLAIVGLVLCVNIMSQINQAAQSGATPSLFCGADGFSCARVYRTTEGKLGGLPAPLWGMFYFLVVLTYLLAVGRRIAAHWFSLLPVALGGMYSGYLLMSLVRLGESCGWCVATHTVNFALIAAVVAGVWLQRDPPPAGLWRLRLVAALAAVTLPMTFMAVGIAQQLQLTNKNYANLGQNFEAFMSSEELQAARFAKAPVLDLPISPDDAVLGPPDAPVRITVFKDFECPGCKQASERVKDIRKKYGDRVCVVMKHYPLEYATNPHRRELAKANPAYESSIHPGSGEAAMAAEAVRLAVGNDGFWKMHDLLFENQKKLGGGRAVLRSLAAQCGVSAEQFDRLMDDPRVREKVNRDCLFYGKVVPPTQGMYGGVPLVYLNGRYFDLGWNTPNAFFERTVGQLLGEGSPASGPATTQTGN